MCRQSTFSSCLIVALGLVCHGCESSGPAVSERTEQISKPAYETAPAQPVSPVKQVREALGIGRVGELKKVGDKIVAADLSGTKVRDLSALQDQALRKLDLRATAVDDLSPLSMQPIEELYLEDSAVVDLSPLRDMPLSVLYLSQTSVTDLSALAGKRFKELNLVDSKVSDLAPLASCSLGTLWLRRCPVTDLQPLANTGLVSLDVGETSVSDISILENMTSLKRLHIAETDVTDLRPLKGKQLERLIFSPWNIAEGLDVVRNMSSLQQLDVSFDDQGGQALRPAEFWKRWDAGEIEATK